MKYLIAFITMFSVVTANADQKCSTQSSEYEASEKMEIKTDVPKHLEGATITITLKDGRTSTVPAEKFKVVPRKQQYIVTKMDRSTNTTCSMTVEQSQKNRISLLGGSGTKDGLDRDDSNSPNSVSVKNRTGAVFGAQYQRQIGVKVLDMPLSVGIQGQTNATGSVLLGVDF